MKTSLWLAGALAAAAIGCSDGGGTAPSKVSIVSPASPVYLRGGELQILVFVDGVPERVDLHKDGGPWANLGANGPFQLTWAADGEPERVHRFVARALLEGRWHESAPLEVFVDRTAPTLVTTSPRDGATRVPLDARLTLTFSERFDPGSTAGAVTVRAGGEPPPLTLHPDPTARVLSIEIEGGLSGSGGVTVEVGPPLRDLAGNTMAPATLTYSLPVWSELGGGPHAPAGALRALVGDGPSAVTESAWLTPGDLGWTDGEAPCSSALTAVQAAGDGPWAACRVAGGIALRRLGASGWWDEGTIPLVNAGSYVNDVGLALVSPGHPLVLWGETFVVDGAYRNRVYGLVRDEARTWQPATPGADGTSYLFELAPAGAGALVGWADGTGLHTARWSDTGWLALASLDSSTWGLAAGLGGVVGFAVDDRLAVRRLDGSRWTPISGPLEELPPGTSRGPAAITVLPDGQPFLAWSRRSDAWSEVVVALRTGEEFGIMMRNRLDAAEFPLPIVGADGAGAPVVAWEQRDGLHVVRLEP